MGRNSFTTSHKIRSREELVKILHLDRRPDVRKLFKIGFTSGGFDILHAGHVNYLEQAKRECDLLLVGVNSDASIKKYKGGHRPIIGEEDRIRLLVSLRCVDYAFLFDERRNATNIQAIKPDFYIKAGDYKESELTSAKYLKSWNGQVIIIPVENDISTSSIVSKIQRLPVCEDSDPVAYGPAIFLDRDGVINDDTGFVHTVEDFKLLPNVIEGLVKFQSMGFKLVIATNQGGIGMGYYTKEDFYRVNSRMLRLFDRSDIFISKVYYCPHSVADRCSCRKPCAGMLERGQRELNIDMSRSFMIGDKESDMAAGFAVGVRTIRIGPLEAPTGTCADYMAEDLLQASMIAKQKDI